ncbi:TIGR02757 family protein [Lacihabitans sp. LS3-19]|uniref:TIGR02757 family protein n=1 Tax=Lacihabitans sp. LS3-19 TaxID=2487335 RepID=UPI0020CDF40E|nr:TIGR02757 family protein [Lacihabitans sp. LS3-19]MCP9767627.1 TIGR02757 family protein [Lacihabitans sp. LS3-19]
MSGILTQNTVDLLNEKYLKFNNPNFITLDPISIPHKFSSKKDIEISGFFAAVLAWGQRKTIISKCKELFDFMDNAPYQFISEAEDSDLKKLKNFKHRTFNFTDLLYFIEFFKFHYSNFESLEDAFLIGNDSGKNIKGNLTNFKSYFFSLEDAPKRTEKHISTPAKNSACKRINMYLRWMVRQDTMGVDFGIWERINPSQLVCPCDIHVQRISQILNLTQRPKADWTMAEEITENLKEIDKEDPTKFDFALFGMGVENYFGSFK